ncbi:MAG: hypothetical protein ABEH43_10620 [Flavobacteriales bacterium]
MSLGTGIGGYGGESEITLSNGTKATGDDGDDGTAGIIFPFQAKYSLSDKWNIGLFFGGLSHFHDEEDSLKFAKTNYFGITGSYYVMHKESSGIVLSLGFGGASHKQEKNNGTEFEFKVFLDGTYLNKFSDTFGFYLNLGFHNYTFDLDDDGDLKTIGIEKWEWSFKGLEVGAGLFVTL